MPLLFLAIAFVWMLQLILSLFQTKRFHRQVADMRKIGPATAVGVSGKNWTLKKYGVLVCDDDRTVIKAAKLTGMTVFASLQEVPELQGLSLERFTDARPAGGIKPKLWGAFMNSAEFIMRYDRKTAEQKAEDDLVEEDRPDESSLAGEATDQS